jgi:hypothetical protein
MPTEVVTQREQTSLVRIDPQALIAQAIEAGSGIEMMERLVALATQVREVQAREAWHEAMAEFQKRCPAIKKTKRASIQTARASYSYSYAPLDEILSVIQPIMGPLGLSVSWRHRIEGDKVVANCRISHTLGHHEESGEIPMPVIVADAERGANAMQRIGIATTYAKRYSLLGIIGMAPEDDPDAKGPNGAEERRHESREQSPGTSGPSGESVINENQVRRLSAIASGQKWTDEQVHDLLTGYQYNSRTEIKVKDYEAICNRLKESPKKPAA